MRKSKFSRSRGALQLESSNLVLLSGVDLNGETNKLIRGSFLDQCDHLRWCRLFDFLHVEAAGHLSQTHFAISAVEASGSILA